MPAKLTPKPKKIREVHIQAPPAAGGPDDQAVYDIIVQGHLDEKWAGAFDRFTIRNARDGNSSLQGSVRDQAAMHGYLTMIRDLGLTLLALKRH